MRPVAMMTPDLAMIAEVMLAAEGFREARILAKKTVTLYSLMIQQLSKQVRRPFCRAVLMTFMSVDVFFGVTTYHKVSSHCVRAVRMESVYILLGCATCFGRRRWLVSLFTQ